MAEEKKRKRITRKVGYADNADLYEEPYEDDLYQEGVYEEDPSGSATGTVREKRGESDEWRDTASDDASEKDHDTI